MARKKRLYRLAIIPAALLAVGITGATMSQADASSGGSCSSSGGLLSAATSALCAATSGVNGLLSGVTGGATSGVTSTVTGTVSSVGTTVNSLTGGRKSSSASTGGTGGSGSGATASGGSGTSPAGAAPGGTATGSTAGSTAGSTTAGTGSAAGGTAAGRAAVTPASREALATSLTRRLSQAGIPAGKTAPKVTTVNLGTSALASRDVTVPRRSLWSATPLSLLIAVAVGLTIGTGIVYAAWRNGDLFRRRRKPRRRYARSAAAS